jgi:DNA polymerase III delta prime subunit
MNELMNMCKLWLIQRYKECLPLSIEPFKWHRVERDDFRRLIETPTEDSPAILQDAALGLLLVLVPIVDTWGRDKIRHVVETDLRGALSLRSLLLLEDTGSEQIKEGTHDSKGTWRVCVHWLIPKRHIEIWKYSLLVLRQKSSIFEEIPVDGIVYDRPDTIKLALDNHRFPRLLLETRHVFNKSPNEVDRWVGADEKIREALRGFSNKFSQPLEKVIAEGIEKLALEYKSSTESKYPERPTFLDRIEIHNFRSIRHLTLAPWSHDRKAQPWIIHGPSGTGKTSLAEALSLFFFKASSRYSEYLDDKDISSLKNASGYVSQYLVPISNSQSQSRQEPRCSVGSKEINAFSKWLIEKRDETEKILLEEAEGTLSAQEDTRKFIHLEGTDLAARLAQSFSKLALSLRTHVDNGFTQAQNLRIKFLRDYGLSAQAKLRETIRNRIANDSLLKALPGVSNNNMAFLKTYASFEIEEGQRANALLQRLNVAITIDEIVKRITRLEPATRKAAFLQEIVHGFKEQHDTLNQVEILIQRFRSRKDLVSVDLSDIKTQADIWATWLLAPKQTDGEKIPTDVNLKELQEKLTKLSGERNELTKKGLSLKPLHEHLAQSLKFIHEYWIKDHFDKCPTCNTSFSDGIINIVSPSHARLEEELTLLRQRFNTLTEEMRVTENRIKALGQPQCPVPKETRDRIDTVFKTLLNIPHSVESLLLSSDTRPHVLSLLEFAQTPPTSIGVLSDPLLEAQKCAESIVEQWHRADVLAEEPDAWDIVRKTLFQVLQQVVEYHLPSTVQAIWWEIAASLTPAFWLLPGRLSFRTETRRNVPRLEVLINQDRLARYVLNNAEQHVLGLAWFFTQHLLKGRFRHAWLLLDDPAQEMDQPTFRDLCRFLATILRLYESQEANVDRFTLVLLLHQEERALDAAREMDSGLHLLGWSQAQTDEQTIRRVLLTGPTYHSPLPQTIIARAS